MTIGRMIKYFLGVVVALVLLTIVGGSWYTVDQGEVGVVLRYGEVQRVDQPGLGFKLPIIDNVEFLSTRDYKVEYPVGAYSKDIQAAELLVTVRFRLDESRAAEVYARYGSLDAAVDRVITPKAPNAARIILGKFIASNAIAERDRLVQEITAAIQHDVEGSGLIAMDTQLSIDFSAAFEDSVEQRMLAEVEVERLKQNLEREKVQANIVRTKAAAERDKAIEVATGVAEAIRLRGEAEATSIQARGQALKNNPSLIYLIQAERWNGTLPTTMLPQGTVPFLDLAQR